MGPKLQKLLSNSEAMPSDALTALLLTKTVGTDPPRSQSPEAGEVHTEGAQENNPEVAADATILVVEETLDVEAGSSKDKGRKRHRGGSSAKSHHKRSNDACTKDLTKDVTGEIAAIDPDSTPIKACKAYADKVPFPVFVVVAVFLLFCLYP